MVEAATFTEQDGIINIPFSNEGEMTVLRIPHLKVNKIIVLE